MSVAALGALALDAALGRALPKGAATPEAAAQASVALRWGRQVPRDEAVHCVACQNKSNPSSLPCAAAKARQCGFLA